MIDQPVDLEQPINRLLWGSNGETFAPTLPIHQALTADEALEMCAWLVTMAEPFADHTFAEWHEAVRST